MPEPAAALDDLARRYWEARVQADPLWATLLGEHDADDLLPDPSLEAEDERIEALESFAAEADALDAAALDAERARSRRMLAAEARADAGVLRHRLAEIAVSPQFLGPQARLLEAAPLTVLADDAQAQAWIGRLGRAGKYLDGAAARLRQGVASGRTPPVVAVGQVLHQLDAYLASPLAEDPFIAVAAPAEWSQDVVARWRERVAGVVRDVVRPGMARYAACLVDEVRPAARSPERSGLSWLSDDESAYAATIVAGTTLALDPRDVHTLGLDAVEALADEYRQLAGPILGTTDVAQVFDRLRHDADLRFETTEEVVSTARDAVARAEAQLPRWLGRVPRTPCEVAPMPEIEARDGTIAYYAPPAADGARPGTYVVNATSPTTRTRFEAEALAFHEAVPGHHTQVALAQELDHLPAFRRQGLVNAYVEGWALYTERLADEMGLYSGPLARLGMLSFDSWRACRLVVDTGLHALGWSRDRAIAYLTDNSPQAPGNIANEVDRYIAWPGQALGYWIGKSEIQRLRADATGRLGPAFDVRGFHDAVLGSGPLTLEALAEVVDAWVLGAGTPQTAVRLSLPGRRVPSDPTAG